MSTKTITLAGSEIKAEFSGSNAWFRNDSADVIYAAAKPGITAGADGVVAILAGQSAPVYGANGAVWLLGTGSVQLIGSDYSTNPFKTSAQAGGSGADEVARAAINAHSGNAEIHVTADEKAAWSAVNYSNPNLLINQDFAVNQRGQTEYTASGYTVDRWQIGGSAKLTPHDGYITFESIVDKATPPLYQIVENPAALNGKTVVLSFDCDLKTEGAWISVQAVTNGSWNPSSYVPIYDTGRSIKSTVITLPENLTDLRLALVIHGTDSAPLAAVDIYGAKLELGKIATPIIPADPATELAKCQRYFCKSYLPETAPGTARAYSGEIILNAAGSSKFGQSYIAFPVSMRIIPTVTIFNPDNGESGGICHSGYADTISAAALVPGTNGFNISAVGLTQGDDYYMHYTASAEI